MPVLSLLPDLPSTVTDRNYLSDGNTDVNPKLAPPYVSPKPLTPSGPNPSWRWWACCRALLPQTGTGPSCWGQVAESTHPKATCGGCPWHQGLLLLVGLGHEKPTDFVMCPARVLLGSTGWSSCCILLYKVTCSFLLIMLREDQYWTVAIFSCTSITVKNKKRTLRAI